MGADRSFSRLPILIALTDALERGMTSALLELQKSWPDAQARSTEEFLQMLRDQSGIVLTPTRRNIEMLVVRPLL